MAVSNTLAARKNATQQEQATVYRAGGMDVKLTPSIVRNYLVSGNKEQVTFQEVAMFINLCKFSGLNPWLKEAYLIKYGNEPATLVTGKEAFMKRAEANPNYDGFEAGIIVVKPETSEIEYRKGTLKLPGEEIIGGWAEVFRKDKAHSTRSEVSFEEYAGRKKDGSLNGQWSKKPSTMIRKTALVQALREAFPSDFGGLYSAEEQGHEEPEFTVPNVVIDEEGQPEAPVLSEKTEDSDNQPTGAAEALFGGK